MLTQQHSQDFKSVSSDEENVNTQTTITLQLSGKGCEGGYCSSGTMSNEY